MRIRVYPYTYRKVQLQLSKRIPPSTNDRFPHLVAARDVSVDERLAKNQAQLSKLRAFYNADRLKTCEGMKEHEIVGTHLVICNYKANKVLQKCRR